MKSLPAEAEGKTIEIWFQDEARVGQQGTLSYIWTEQGSRPAVVRDNRRTSAYIFGAVCPERAVGAAIVMPCANMDAMNVHLEEISHQIGTNAHGIIVCDGAGWHQRGKKLRIPANLTLLTLPPYAPELNPMENVWQYLRGNYLSMLVWKNYKAIVDACCEAWNSFLADTSRVLSVTTRSWAEVKT